MQYFNYNFASPVQARFIRLRITGAYLDAGGGNLAVIIGEFYAYAGTWSCEFGDTCIPTILESDDVTPGSIDLVFPPISLPTGQYFQYKVTMDLGSSLTSPDLNEVNVSGSPATPPVPPPPAPTYFPSPQVESISEEVTPEEQTLIQQLYEKLKDLEKRLEILEKREAVAVVKPPKKAEPKPISSKTYIVQPKDYLIKIAQTVYGNGGRWYELVNLNKDKYPELITNPNALKIGWELKY